MDTRTSIFHSFSDTKHGAIFSPVFFVIIFVFILLGVATGYVIAQTKTSNTTMNKMEIAK